MSHLREMPYLRASGVPLAVASVSFLANSLQPAIHATPVLSIHHVGDQVLTRKPFTMYHIHENQRRGQPARLLFVPGAGRRAANTGNQRPAEMMCAGCQP